MPVYVCVCMFVGLSVLIISFFFKTSKTGTELTANRKDELVLSSCTAEIRMMAIH